MFSEFFLTAMNHHAPKQKAKANRRVGLVMLIDGKKRAENAPRNYYTRHHLHTIDDESQEDEQVVGLEPLEVPK